MDVEANRQSRPWYPRERPIDGADVDSHLDDVVSLETHGDNNNMFVGNGCANL